SLRIKKRRVNACLQTRTHSFKFRVSGRKRGFFTLFFAFLMK
ncbi:NAD(P)H-flavin reductase, partial [Vibrio parahaemolyticus VP2007-007]